MPLGRANWMDGPDKCIFMLIKLIKRQVCVLHSSVKVQFD